MESKTSVTSEIFYSKAGLDIVANPFLVGEKLQQLSYQCSSDFVEFSKQRLVGKKVTVLNILMGGRFYKLYEAMASKAEMTVSLAEVRASRSSDADGVWSVKVWHDEEKSNVTKEETKRNLDQCEVLCIGDTIATGTTLAGVLENVAAKMDSPKTKDVLLFSIAGADIDERLSDVATKFKSVHTVFANAKFNLDSNGTDLGFVGAECDPNSQAFFDENLGDFQKVMKCACWDWGDRFTQVKTHLEEVLEYYEGLTEPFPSLIKESLISAKESLHGLES